MIAPKIKICGVTRPGDAAHAAAAGADFVGLNFWPRSKRYLPVDRAPEVAAAARVSRVTDVTGAGPRVVGVFVNASLDDIVAAARRVPLDIVQLHGDETPADAAAVTAATGLSVWKALAATAASLLDDWLRDVASEAILLDAPSAGYGGSGTAFDWSLARAARQRLAARQLVLAGGLTPDNVAAAIAAVEPWAVDVASGVESAPGIKDPAKITAFITSGRTVARS
jgi:phosphoribosylanthranilate isomerase